ncbi:60S RIBOSOMAL EXPORT PROTEIN NMD3 [Anaeramoeba flamelloides]|uniref:60S ribosomal export protein NMD3 n=1 Tax=Anaeramoeba flamelloides TaxID=1746091 RepID=A0AAV8ADY4_9EUKA|nr:60S RIBOSOMAL EXPORT PROTEIN NMD3 [Anaeramoeba flamelloides]
MMNSFKQTPSRINCCLCGTLIQPNPSNMCVNCIRNEVDITEGISKSLTVNWCKKCGRYLLPPAKWIFAELESRDLLSLCLKKIKGLSKVKLIDASFLYTEPHSKRLRIKCTVQQEVFVGTILQQTFQVIYVVHNLMCPDCHKSETDHTWKSLAQVRQKVPHKKTFFYLEQLILKKNLHNKMIDIEESPFGIDFFFSHRSHAKNLVSFLQSHFITRFNSSKTLISQDTNSNTYNYKYTFCVEIAPICRDDFICLPPQICKKMGGISPFLICNKLSNLIHLMDFWTLKTYEIDTLNYWRDPFESTLNSKYLTGYMVVDIEYTNIRLGKYMLAEVSVSRLSDIENNDTVFITKTHLGNLLNVGDYVLGYDLSSLNVNTDLLEDYEQKGITIPETVLIKKYYPKKLRRKYRNWELKRLKMKEMEKKKAKIEDEEQQIEEFYEEIEENEDIRKKINLYHKNDEKNNQQENEKEKFKSKNNLGMELESEENEKEENQDEEEEEDESLYPDLPTIPIEELLDKLNLKD